MPVFGPGFVLEPQAQIIYAALSSPAARPPRTTTSASRPKPVFAVSQTTEGVQRNAVQADVGVTRGEAKKTATRL
jgi:hypothetical protein